ncbi:TerB family tellurite resistance protein [Thioalkalivibrio sp. XN279]|uniref:tellurite resistance TerB family protein n=1 Tax=Thioalkalivibrio sp. XN279 TaxID=2714953 RepID=UPI00140BF0F5|nr:TerB family tellurite resistance protein [Thioalkalivibrio sp. XN279]NHA14079.1 TerB family tellurite resistance protein [Thioalkalivibrio sp. XN279]
MIAKLKELLRESLGAPADGEAGGGHDLRLATAALLLEMARADRDETEQERRAAGAVLARHFALEQGAAEALLARADSSLEHTVSLYEFTRVLNDTLSPEERREVVRLVAEVAASDGVFDKHEQHLLSKLADLLHLRRAEYATIRASVLRSTDALD